MELAFTRHATAQMRERGVSESEVVQTLQSGIELPAKLGRSLALQVFSAGYRHRGVYYPEKEVRVIHKEEFQRTVVITVLARYGIWSTPHENHL
jgi:hypothetical protein